MAGKPISDFSFARMPEIHFGVGALKELPGLILRGGRRVLLMTGSTSFQHSLHYEKLTHFFARSGIDFSQVSVHGEPSPGFVDQVVARYREKKPDWVVGIGGGSVIDAAKAVSAMLPQEGSVVAFLEGMESRIHDGKKIPFIAIPTTSGTGAEATKNAVLSEVGNLGFKCSLRHDHFVPDIALIDPELMCTCPPAVTVACGLDALTQLLESYVSTKASPMTDALALSGMECVAAGFIRAYENGAVDIEARGFMAYAALMSGVTLANAGLGLVHGFAGPMGGFFAIPHGEVCGTLLGETTRITIDVLFENAEKNRPVLEKYARAGVLLSGQTASSLKNDCDLLVGTLRRWIDCTKIPRLHVFNISRADFPKILGKTTGKNSPVTLSCEQMTSILEARL